MTIFLALLTILLVVFKVTNIIAWSWILVLLPVLIPVGILLFGVIIYFTTLMVTLSEIYIKDNDLDK